MIALWASYYDQPLFEEAIKQLKRQNKKSHTITYIQALDLFSHGENEKAFHTIQKDKYLLQHSSLAKMIKAAVLSTRKKHEKAASVWDSLVKKHRDIDIFRLWRGDEHFCAQDYSSAQKDYQYYAKKHPENRSVSAMLFTTLLQVGNPEEISTFKKHILARPIQNRTNLKEALLNVETHPASKRLQDITSDQVEEILTILRRGKTEDQHKTIVALTKSIEKYRNTVGAEKYRGLCHYIIAQLYIIRHETSGYAKELFLSYIEYPTEEIHALFTQKEEQPPVPPPLLLADYNFKHNNPLAAAEIYEHEAKIHPLFCSLWKQAAVTRLLIKDFQGATTNYQQLAKCAPESGTAHLQYADLVMRTNCTEAIPHFLKSIEILGDNLTAADGLARCYSKLGKTQESKAYNNKYRELYFKNGGNPVNFFFTQPSRK